MKTYIIYNPHAGIGNGESEAQKLTALYGTDVLLQDMTGIESYAEFLAPLTAKDQLVICGGDGTLKTLMVFPSIFKGEHVKHTEMVAVHTGKEIEVSFDHPCALQIDGETVLNVTSYRVKAGKTAKSPATV